MTKKSSRNPKVESLAVGSAEPGTAFSKEALLSSARYKGKRDILSAVLENGKKYTIKETDEKINDFMRREI